MPPFSVPEVIRVTVGLMGEVFFEAIPSGSAMRKALYYWNSRTFR